MHAGHQGNGFTVSWKRSGFEQGGLGGLHSPLQEVISLEPFMLNVSVPWFFKSNT